MWIFVGIVFGICFLISILMPTTTSRNTSVTPTKYGDVSDGIGYEHYVATKLQQQGFTDVEVTKASGDFGADVLAVDKGGHKICFQCKLVTTGHKVGVRAVQEVSSARTYYGCTRAAVVTTSVFTDAAKELAQKSGVELYERFYGD